MVNAENQLSTEQRILAAAKQVFIRKGMDGARMQDIADEAGINKALLHYYFRNKEKLFEVIFIEAAQRLFPLINEIFTSDLPLFEKITRFCEEYITMVQENPYLPVFVISEISKDPDLFINKVMVNNGRPDPRPLIAQIQEEVAKGTIRPIDPIQLLLNMVSMVIFPFVVQPMFQRIVGVTDEQYRMVQEKRKKEIPQFIIAALKN